MISARQSHVRPSYSGAKREQKTELRPLNGPCDQRNILDTKVDLIITIIIRPSKIEVFEAFQTLIRNYQIFEDGAQSSPDIQLVCYPK